MRVGLEGTERWHSRAPQSRVFPGTPSLEPPRTFSGPGQGWAICDTAGARCWPRGSFPVSEPWLRGEPGPGPQPGRGESSCSAGSHSGSDTLGWRGSETQTTEWLKPTAHEGRGWSRHSCPSAGPARSV